MGGGEVHTGLWWEDLRERDYLEKQGVDGIILRWIFSKLDVGAWTGFIWLRIGTSSRVLVNAEMNLRVPENFLTS